MTNTAIQNIGSTATALTGAELLEIATPVPGLPGRYVSQKVTTSAIAGIIVGTQSAQLANTFYSGPSSGSAAYPTFRAMVVADLPHGTANQVLIVNAAGTALAFGRVNVASTSAVTGALGASNGGTGLSTFTIGDILYASASNAFTALADVATGSVLMSGGVGVAPAYTANPIISGTLTVAGVATFNSTAVVNLSSGASSGYSSTLSGTATGIAMTVANTNASNANPSIKAATNGSGACVQTSQTGTGIGVYSVITNVSNANACFYADTNGSGQGIFGTSSGSGQAVYGANSGGGYGLFGYQTSATGGYAIWGQVANGSNSGNAIYGTSNGTGAAINAVATGSGHALDFSGGPISGSGGILSTSATAGIGYATGAGGTVTQATSKSTGVTLSKVCGAITMNNAALAAATIVSFVLTNTAIAATDVLVLNHISGGTPGSYTLNARAAAGSATIDVRNNTAGSLSEAIVIQYTVNKGVNA